MSRRTSGSARQRAALFDLPTDEAALLRRYTLSDDNIEHVRVQRGGTQPAGLRAPALRVSIHPLGGPVGPHPDHWRILVVKAPIAALAYDPALYRSRPAPGQSNAHGPGTAGSPRRSSAPPRN